jgi:hypothetical protein
MSSRNLRCAARPSTQDENTWHFRTQSIHFDAQTQLQEEEGSNHRSSKLASDMIGIVMVQPNLNNNFHSRE